MYPNHSVTDLGKLQLYGTKQSGDYKYPQRKQSVLFIQSFGYKLYMVEIKD